MLIVKKLVFKLIRNFSMILNKLDKYVGMESDAVYKAMAKDTPLVPYKKCSLATRVGAIFAAIFSLGLALISARCLEACKGNSCIKVGAQFYKDVFTRLEVDWKNNPIETLKGFDKYQVRAAFAQEIRYYRTHNA